MHNFDGSLNTEKGAGVDYLFGGYFFCVWALICDLEHACTNYDLPNPTANACCPLCPVGLGGGLLWWDFRPNAAWLAHIYTVQKWLAKGFNSMLYGSLYSRAYIHHNVFITLCGISCVTNCFGNWKCGNVLLCIVLGVITLHLCCCCDCFCGLELSILGIYNFPPRTKLYFF